MNFDLTEDQKMVQDMVQKLAKSYEERSIDTSIDQDLAAELGANGLLGVCANPELGGSGLDLLSLAICVHELAQVDAAAAVVLAAHNALTAMNANSEAFFVDDVPAFGPGIPFSNETPFAADEGDRWTVHGTGLVANPFGAKQAAVLASTNGNVGLFLVPLQESDSQTPMGLRGANWSTVTFSGVSAECLSNNVDLKAAQTAVAAAAVGIARAGLHEGLAYASERVQFGKPLTKFQATQFKLANMATEIDAAWLMVQAAASVAAPESEATSALRFASRVANATVDEALQLHGGYGYTAEYPIERLYRDAKMFLPAQ